MFFCHFEYKYIDILYFTGYRGGLRGLRWKTHILFSVKESCSPMSQLFKMDSCLLINGEYSNHFIIMVFMSALSISCFADFVILWSFLILFHFVFVGEHGSVIVIYKEGDDCVNSTSEYLAKVLDQLPTIMQKEGVPKLSSSNSNKFTMKNAINQANASNVPHLTSNINGSALHHRRVENHLSPIAKTFISRANGVNIPYINNHNFPPVVHPLLNLEYLQKLHWPLLAAGGGYDPLAAQLIHNYLIMQELQKIETRRLALQSHYLKMQNMRWPKKIHSSTKQHTTPSNSTNSSGLQISAWFKVFIAFLTNRNLAWLTFLLFFHIIFVAWNVWVIWSKLGIVVCLSVSLHIFLD